METIEELQFKFKRKILVRCSIIFLGINLFYVSLFFFFNNSNSCQEQLDQTGPQLPLQKGHERLKILATSLIDMKTGMLVSIWDSHHQLIVPKAMIVTIDKSLDDNDLPLWEIAIDLKKKEIPALIGKLKENLTVAPPIEKLIPTQLKTREANYEIHY